MRLAHAVFAAAGLLGLSAVALSGRQLASPDVLAEAATSSLITNGASASPTETPHARPVAPVEPSPGSQGLQRIEPRAPLSELSLALPPRPKTSEWKGALLSRPVATAAGVIEAMGYHLMIADVRAVELRQSCGEGQAKWPCGVVARTAFRGWLRGRALECDIPPKTPPGIVTAHCMIGKQDAGSWLVANGWAAPVGDRYRDEAARARQRRVGMWGEGG